jgi:dipeptidyl aminopeptidase/acylaminoacyl peptidase
VQLARGADFYMQPVWHPQGHSLAWIEWNHPNMPWDGTRLKLAQISGGNLPHLVNETLIAGDDNTPICQPLFSADGRWLSYITSSGEWEDLVLFDLSNGTRRVLFHSEGAMLSQPAWVQGVHTYGWSHTSQSLFYISDQRGRATLWQISLNGSRRQIELGPYTWISQLAVSPVADQLAFLASAPDTPDRVVRWDSEKIEVLAYSGSEVLSADWFAPARELSWKAADGTTVYGWYYPPTHPQVNGSGLPPAIVYVHGGPTSTAPATFNIQRSYFTSRGYAWLDINYRGSTSFGRSYMLALRRHWGDVDTEDAGNAALALAENGLADPERLIVLGGSAGGYLVLNTLIRYPGRYKAGVCNYGVSNLFTLEMDTHKFEAHYNDSLVGPLPEAAGRYHAWSPIFHAAEIRDSLAIFQGSSDVVVPPSQSEEIVAALREQGIPCFYQLYEGEGHGFRKPETLNDYYQKVERFLQQHVLFAPPANPAK